MDAYLFAENNKNPPREIAELSYIDRFGVMAVYGRPVLSYGEIQRLILAENVVQAFQARKKSDNWAEWANNNPTSARLLTDIEKDIDAKD